MSNLLQELHSMKQGEHTLSTYFTDMKIIWDELENLRPTPTCTCHEEIQRDRTCDLLSKRIEWYLLQCRIPNPRHEPSTLHQSRFCYGQPTRNLASTATCRFHCICGLTIEFSGEGTRVPRQGSRKKWPKNTHDVHTARKPTTQWKTVILNMVFHRVTAQEIKHLPCESLMIHPVQVSSRSNLSMAANQINHSKFSRKTTIIWWLYFIPQTRIVPPIHNLLPLLKIRFQEHTISSLSQLGIPTTSNLIWILDSGASDHVCPNIKLFSTIHLINPLSVKFPNGTTILAYYSGSVEFSDTLHLHNVLLHLHFFFAIIRN